MQDGKLRGASNAAKNIRDVHGAPQNLGVPYTERQIFETTNDLMPAEIQFTTRPVGSEDSRARQHENYTAPAYGAGGFASAADNVDRSDFPESPVLEGQGANQGEPFTPPSAAGTSTMMGKSPRKSSGTRGGDFSSTGNRHPL
jgi:hypothetical protein